MIFIAHPSGSPGNGRPAHPSGSGTMHALSARSYSAKLLYESDATRSPTEKSLTSEPKVSTMPKASWPNAPGGCGKCIQSGPDQGIRFEAQTPQPCSRKRTCVGPGMGRGTVSIRMRPAPVITAARIDVTLSCFALCMLRSIGLALDLYRLLGAGKWRPTHDRRRRTPAIFAEP